MSIQKSILDKAMYQCGDYPMVFPNAYKCPDKLVQWDDVERCLNNPWWYNVEILDNNNMKNGLFIFASSPSLKAARPPSANVIDGAPLSTLDISIIISSI